MVAATGGHLTQLVRLSSKLRASDESIWVTFDTEQSRSLLRGKQTFFVPYVSPRDWKGTLHAFQLLSRFVRKHEFEAVYSTGAAIALAAYLQPKLMRTPKIYIESVSRTAGPSLTGRLVSCIPSVRLYTQHVGWATRRWRHTESVMAHYQTRVLVPGHNRPLRLFITLGTIRPYRFDALIEAVLATGMVNSDTVWQVGASTREDLPGTTYQQMTADDFLSTAASADVVITHAGVGTVIQLLELGKSPVVVPRERIRNEHVDDHQFQISRLLEERNLAVVVRADNLSRDHIERAAIQRTDTNV